MNKPDIKEQASQEEERDGQFLVEENSSLNALKVDGWDRRETDERRTFTSHEFFAKRMIKGIDHVRQGKLNTKAALSLAMYLGNPDSVKGISSLFKGVNSANTDKIIVELLEARGETKDSIIVKMMPNSELSQHLIDVRGQTKEVLDQSAEEIG